MMKLTIISVGKIKEKYFVNLIDSHSKSIRKKVMIEHIEVPDEKCPEKLSEKEMVIVKDKEGKRISTKIPDRSRVFVLAIDGKQLSSGQFLNKLTQYREENIVFIIGGSLGLSDEIIRKADVKLSFSNMTFPHQMMKVMLLEQLDQTINRM